MGLLHMISVALLLATPLRAAETYDLIFKTGTLDDVAVEAGLTYDRTVTLATDPAYGARNTGEVALIFAPDDVAALRFVQGAQHRNLGQFPVSTGNPVIMYFVETVLRDMAGQAGGSPFYIRNRLKEALLEVVPIEDMMVPYEGGQVAAKQITLRPFEDDPNRAKMGIYGDLSLRFVMSDDVPGWYVSLSAMAPGGADDPGYRNTVVLVEGARE
ncbi:hypothetical protein ACJ5NV_09275 [Loktanella agnita]